jgi:hypothetical protein
MEQARLTAKIKTEIEKDPHVTISREEYNMRYLNDQQTKISSMTGHYETGFRYYKTC